MQVLQRLARGYRHVRCDATQGSPLSGLWRKILVPHAHHWASLLHAATTAPRYYHDDAAEVTARHPGSLRRYGPPG